MKKRDLTMLLTGLFILASLSSFSQSKGFYYENISTPDNMMNFIVVFSPPSYAFTKRNDGTGYSSVALVVSNDKGTQPLSWTDYKVYVLLKSGKMFYNFKTAATSGDYACNYTVAVGEKHKQFVCFENEFNVDDIDKVWLSFNDYKFFLLSYSPN